MIRIHNNTNQDFRRMLVLYAKELATVKGQDIESITFDYGRMIVFGVDKLLLEVDDTKEVAHGS